MYGLGIWQGATSIYRTSRFTEGFESGLVANLVDIGLHEVTIASLFDLSIIVIKVCKRILDIVLTGQAGKKRGISVYIHVEPPCGDADRVLDDLFFLYLSPYIGYGAGKGKDTMLDLIKFFI